MDNLNKYNIKFYKSIRKICNFYLEKIFRPKVINKIVLDDKPILLIGNHKSGYDILMLWYALKNENLRFMAKKEFFDTKLSNPFYMCGAFPIDRDKNDLVALKTAVKLLKNNEKVVIFPEGTRNKTENVLLPFKKGFSNIALLGKANVVPFAIKGTYKLFKHPTIVFGEPIDFKEINIEKDKMDSYVEEKVKKLLMN